MLIAFGVLLCGVTGPEPRPAHGPNDAWLLQATPVTAVGPLP